MLRSVRFLWSTMHTVNQAVNPLTHQRRKVRGCLTQIKALYNVVEKVYRAARFDLTLGQGFGRTGLYPQLAPCRVLS